MTESAQNEFEVSSDHAQVLESIGQGQSVRIIARAGTGKTAILRWLANQFPDKRILYLVFDASSRQSARASFPANVRVETGHSLAFRLCVRPYPDRLYKFERASDGRSISGAQIRQMIGDCAYARVSHTDMAAAIRRCVQRFQRSADQRIHAGHTRNDDYSKKALASAKQIGETAFAHHVVAQAKRLWKAMLQPETPILHDTYLKWLQLFSPTLDYDLIIGDEWQDTAPVLSEFVQTQPVPIARVGDPAQQIYAWRDAINALDGEREHESAHALTRSFRCPQTVTDKANAVLASAGHYPLMRSTAKTGTDCVDPTQPLTVICRTNRVLATQALDFAQRGIEFAIVGGIKPVLRQIESALVLYEGRKTQDAWLGQYDTWQQLKDEADDSGDLSLSHLVNFVERHGRASRECLAALESAGEREQGECARTLITAHQAKGLEWHQVHLCSDLAPANKLIERIEAGHPLSVSERETLNTLYVAITRSCHALSMDHSLAKAMDRFHAIAQGHARQGRTNLNAFVMREAS